MSSLVQFGKSDVKLRDAGCPLIQNEIKTMTDTIATLSDQLREQQNVNNDQQVKIMRHEIKNQILFTCDGLISGSPYGHC